MTKDFSPWLKFETSLATWMRQFKRPSLEFKSGRQAIPGFPSDGFRADGLLTNGKVLLALEVEVKQTHPDTNVGKYWLLSEYQQYEKVILFHVYTPAYNSYGWRKTLGEFYASKMGAEIPFEYHLLDVRDAINTECAFNDVTNTLGTRIKIEFGNELARPIATGQAGRAGHPG
jgi:hypothetical protein